MTRPRFKASCFSLILVALYVPGCGAYSQAPALISPEGGPAARGTKSMSSGVLSATSGAPLIYAASGCGKSGGLCVLSYPEGRLVGTVRFKTSGPASTLCSDANGNVYVTNGSEVLEFAHGGTKAVATFNLPGDSATGCSIDPTSSKVAVVFKGSGSDVAVFQDATGTPSLYDSGLDSIYCGYDAAGDLFVDGYTGSGDGLSELAAGASQFQNLSVDKQVYVPGEVQWDGEHITWQDQEKRAGVIYQLSVSGSHVTTVGSTKLKGSYDWPEQSWIYKSQVLIPFSDHRPQRGTRIGLWKYPQGGNSIATFKTFGKHEKYLSLDGITVSVPASL